MSENTERLDAIQARVGAATRGPWEERCIDYGERPSVWKDEEYAFPIGMCVHENCQAEAVYEKGDAEFIAAAPADVAFLLAELRKRDEVLWRVERLAAQWDALADGDKYYARHIRIALDDRT